jgi:hypothetical protein
MNEKILNSNFWSSVRKNHQLQHKISLITSLPRNEKSPIPLSLTQEQLWVIEQLNPEQSTQNMSVTYRIKNKLKTSIIEKVLAEIVQRHEILRTSFIEVGKEPKQEIKAYIKVILPVINLEELLNQRKEEEAKKIIRQEKNKPFKLSESRLWRSLLIRLSEQDHIFLFITHHLIWDVWSSRVFRQEFSTLYHDFSNNKPSSLPDLSIQYADYTQWQRQWLQIEKLNELQNYWAKKFEGNISSLILPIDRPYSSTPNNNGASENVSLSLKLTKALKHFSHQEGVSLFVTLLTSFNLLLNRYSEQKDLLVCTTTSGRNKSQLKKLIGYFNNIILLRTHLSQDFTFRKLLNQVSKTYLESLAYQDFPFQQLSQIPNLRQVSLTRAMFSFLNIPIKQTQVEGLNLVPFGVNKQTTDFDIFLSLYEQDQKIQGNLRYKTHLFNRETILQLIDNFANLLEIIVKNPNIYLKNIPEFFWNDNLIIDFDGNLVQLEEIESIIHEYPNIKESLVVINNSKSKETDKSLVAYVVVQKQKQIQISDLRFFLRKKLPEYLIPDSFVFLDKFPRNYKGEVDYRKLQLSAINGNREEEFVEPFTEIQIKLVVIWQEVLGINKIGIDDNFFSLGGNSLLAARIFTRINNHFHIQLSLRYLFESSTIRELAVIIDNILWLKDKPLSLNANYRSKNLEEGEI